MDTEEIRDKTNNKLYDSEELLNKKLGTDMNYRFSYIWQLVVAHILLQISWFIGAYMLFHAKSATIIWGKYRT